MTAIAMVSLLGCAISTDSFQDKGEGDWVKDEAWTRADFDRDRNFCRAESYSKQDDDVEITYANAADLNAYAMMRARQAFAPCMRRLGWRRESEASRAKRR